MIIISQPHFNVNIWHLKCGFFCVLYHFHEIYLCEIPSCIGGRNMLDWWYKKGDTKYGKYTCRPGFSFLPFYINATRKRTMKIIECFGRDSNHHESPVDPAESEVTQWLNPRNWNDPRQLSGVISCLSGPGSVEKKKDRKIRPNTAIISYSKPQVNGELSSRRENLCPAQKHLISFMEHSVLKSGKFHAIL